MLETDMQHKFGVFQQHFSFQIPIQTWLKTHFGPMKFQRKTRFVQGSSLSSFQTSGLLNIHPYWKFERII